MSTTSHTQSPDSPTLDEDYEEEIPMDESASPDATEVRMLTKAERKAIAKANRDERASDAKAVDVASRVTYVVAILATVLAVQGMIMFWAEVVGLVLWASVILAGVLEGTLVCAALWDRAAAMRGRSTRATATWIVAAASGILAGIHELAEPMPGGGSEWVLEPFTILAATVRVIPPLLAAWLWHKLLVEAGHTAEGRTTSEVRRAKRMHRYARLAHTQRTIEKQIEKEQDRQKPSEKRLETLHAEHAKVVAAARSAYDRVLQVMPGTDPRLPIELDQWARAIAAGDTMVAMTDARIEADAQTATAVMKVPGQPRPQQRRRPVPATAPASQQRPTSPAPAPVAPERRAQPVVAAPTAAPVQRGPYLAPAPAVRTAEANPADDIAIARALFDRAISEDSFTKPDASWIRREGNIEKSPAAVRKWVAAWWAEHQESLTPGGRDEQQLAADAARPASGDGERATA